MKAKRWAPICALGLAVMATARVSLADRQPQEASRPVRPADDLAGITGLERRVSQAVVHAVRNQENAIPWIHDARVSDAATDGTVVFVAYGVSENEVCVRSHPATGQAALRAAREACRRVNGTFSSVAAIRCVQRPQGATGCASTSVLWGVRVLPGPESGRPHYHERILSMRIDEDDVDGDPALELVVDFVREVAYVDPGEMASGGDIFGEVHEAIAIDDDGTVLARTELSNAVFGRVSLETRFVFATVAGDSLRFGIATCDDVEACPPEWGPPRRVEREPAMTPARPRPALP